MNDIERKCKSILGPPRYWIGDWTFHNTTFRNFSNIFYHFCNRSDFSQHNFWQYDSWQLSLFRGRRGSQARLQRLHSLTSKMRCNFSFTLKGLKMTEGMIPNIFGNLNLYTFFVLREFLKTRKNHILRFSSMPNIKINSCLTWPLLFHRVCVACDA